MLQLAWETGFCWDVFKGLSWLQILYLNNNYLAFLPPGALSHLTALRGLDLNSNRLIQALAPGDLPANLEVLDMSRNQLLSLDPNLLASLRAVDIMHTRFICECDLHPLITWLNQTNVTVFGSRADTYCTYPNMLAGMPLSSVSMEGCDEEEVLKALKLSLFVSCMVTLTLFLVTILMVTKLRGLCFMCYRAAQRLLPTVHAERCESDTYKYEAYLCFSGRDFEWVQRALLRYLDAQIQPVL